MNDVTDNEGAPPPEPALELVLELEGEALGELGLELPQAVAAKALAAKVATSANFLVSKAYPFTVGRGRIARSVLDGPDRTWRPREAVRSTAVRSVVARAVIRQESNLNNYVSAPNRP
ncbi:MAG: hypothetical protein ACRDP1_17095 [Nocardioidaceae bacterium]